MILPIAHRINTIEESNSLPSCIGIEFDVHAYGNELVVAHDPYVKGVKLKKFLEHYKNRLCAINIKEDGIEEEVIDLSIKIGIENFFLFDVNFPQIYKLGNKYQNHLCLRISEFEKPFIEKLREFASYLWIDTFNGKFWMSEKEIIKTKELKYKLCFVSPELQIANIKKQINFSKEIQKNETFFDDKDLICTKDYKIYSRYW